MEQTRAEGLVAALNDREVRAYVDGGHRIGRASVVIRDSRDTVWWSAEHGWTWGPNFEHAFYAEAPAEKVADKIVKEREECSQCIMALGGKAGRS